MTKKIIKEGDGYEAPVNGNQVEDRSRGRAVTGDRINHHYHCSYTSLVLVVRQL
ncbi:hypothetical protein HanRHA438_Chr04g0187131 [Helianthus annuus]|nr:hypothetical protein HanRHA438_Chr04g0187131 [Helianthus annuus]